jgi:hypothetical protein
MQALPLQIASPVDFRQAVHAVLAASWARDARTLWWVDPDFDGWPLDDPVLIQGLTTWLRRPLRRLVLLADRYDRFDRQFPRFSRWRVDWAHAVDARAPADAFGTGLPTLVLDDGPVLLQLLERHPPRGRAMVDAAEAWSAREQIDAGLQRSVPSWPVKPLGL